MTALSACIPPKNLYERIFGPPNFGDTAALVAKLESEISKLENIKNTVFPSFFNIYQDGGAQNLKADQTQNFAKTYRRFSEKLSELEKKAKKITAFLDSSQTKHTNPLSLRSIKIMQQIAALIAFKANELTPHWVNLNFIPYEPSRFNTALRIWFAPFKFTYNVINNRTNSRITGLAVATFVAYETYIFFKNTVCSGLYSGTTSVGLHCVVALGLVYVASKISGR